MTVSDHAPNAENAEDALASSRVVVRRSDGSGLWSHPLTGQPLIDYVPAFAFHAEEAGEVTIVVEEAAGDKVVFSDGQNSQPQGGEV